MYTTDNDDEDAVVAGFGGWNSNQNHISTYSQYCEGHGCGNPFHWASSQYLIIFCMNLIDDGKFFSVKNNIFKCFLLYRQY